MVLLLTKYKISFDILEYISTVAVFRMLICVLKSDAG